MVWVIIELFTGYLATKIHLHLRSESWTTLTCLCFWQPCSLTVRVALKSEGNSEVWILVCAILLLTHNSAHLTQLWIQHLSLYLKWWQRRCCQYNWWGRCSKTSTGPGGNLLIRCQTSSRLKPSKRWPSISNSSSPGKTFPTGPPE